MAQVLLFPTKQLLYVQISTKVSHRNQSTFSSPTAASSPSPQRWSPCSRASSRLAGLLGLSCTPDSYSIQILLNPWAPVRSSEHRNQTTDQRRTYFSSVKCFSFLKGGVETLPLYLLSLLLFRLGAWASSALAFWVREIWEEEQDVKPED